MDFGVINTTLTSVARLITEIKENVTDLYTTKSLPEITKLTTVQPLTVISRDMMAYEATGDICATMLSVFCGYYLQAVSLLTQVRDAEVVRVLDRLNPDRDDSGFFLSEGKSPWEKGAWVGKESFEAGVMKKAPYRYSIADFKHSLPSPRYRGLGLESIKPDSEKPNIENMKTMNDMASFAAGKQLVIKIVYGDPLCPQAVDVPVQVRLAPAVVPDGTVVNMLTYKKDDLSAVERWHTWRAGRVAFISDLIFAQDLLDEYKRMAIADETGTMQEIVRRVNNAKKYGVLTKNPSLVSASNIFIISSEMAALIESKLGKRLTSPAARAQAFDNTYAMLLAVVNKEMESVTFYTRGVAAGSTFSLKSVKKAAKGAGPDVLDIMKAMNQGSAFSL